jgi:hypothetical protein
MKVPKLLPRLKPRLIPELQVAKILQKVVVAFLISVVKLAILKQLCEAGIIVETIPLARRFTNKSA